MLFIYLEVLTEFDFRCILYDLSNFNLLQSQRKKVLGRLSEIITRLTSEDDVKKDDLLVTHYHLNNF